MKKHLLIAATAAMISVPAMADISIKGDAFVSIAGGDLSNDRRYSDKASQRVRLFFTGRSGATKLTAVVRSNGSTRVQTGGTAANNGDSDIQMDSLYLTTKVGPVSLKVGDWWATIGFGARSKGGSKKDALMASIKVSGWTIGAYLSRTNQDEVHKDNSIFAKGKAGPVAIKLVHNPATYTDVALSGKFDIVSFGFEQWKDNRDGVTKNDTRLIHIGAKLSGVQLDIAQLKNDALYGSNTAKNNGNSKFAPLGSMLVGRNARGETATAVANVGAFTEILGIAAAMDLSGNNIKFIYTDLKSVKNGADTAFKGTGTELIFSRKLAGAKLTANWGKFDSKVDDAADATVQGLRLDVKF